MKYVVPRAVVRELEGMGEVCAAALEFCTQYCEIIESAMKKKKGGSDAAVAEETCADAIMDALESDAKGRHFVVASQDGDLQRRVRAEKQRRGNFALFWFLPPRHAVGGRKPTTIKRVASRFFVLRHITSTIGFVEIISPWAGGKAGTPLVYFACAAMIPRDSSLALLNSRERGPRGLGVFVLVFVLDRAGSRARSSQQGPILSLPSPPLPSSSRAARTNIIIRARRRRAPSRPRHTTRFPFFPAALVERSATFVFIETFFFSSGFDSRGTAEREKAQRPRRERDQDRAVDPCQGGQRQARRQRRRDRKERAAPTAQEETRRRTQPALMPQNYSQKAALKSVPKASTTPLTNKSPRNNSYAHVGAHVHFTAVSTP